MKKRQRRSFTPAFKAETVRFRWRDHRDGRVKTLDLDAPEFLRRFLLHVLPRRFVRVRHYGILANRTRRQKLRACRQQLDVPVPPAPAAESTADLMQRVTGHDIDACPDCGVGRLRTVAELAPSATRLPAASWDTS